MSGDAAVEIQVMRSRSLTPGIRSYARCQGLLIRSIIHRHTRPKITIHNQVTMQVDAPSSAAPQAQRPPRANAHRRPSSPCSQIDHSDYDRGGQKPLFGQLSQHIFCSIHLNSQVARLRVLSPASGRKDRFGRGCLCSQPGLP